MKQEIIEHINQLEKEKEITILLAVESGSRAWGCPSPDSDYDVRIMFHRSKADYLAIDEKADSLDYFHGELLDINGWDIKKTFKLIRKSNVTPFEWTQSPIIYKEVDGFSKTVLELSRFYFRPRHPINHYRGIAKNSYFKAKTDETIKLKKLFYVLRPIMAAKWIIERNEVPPMDIPNLISIIPDKNIVDHINDLLEFKKSANEDYVHQVDPMISNFIEKEFDLIDSVDLPKQTSYLDASRLNKAFRDIID